MSFGVNKVINSQSQQILTEIVKLFVQKNKQERLLELLSNPKRYSDGIWELTHDPRYFAPQVITKTSAFEQTSELIYARLKKMGFQQNCFVVSSDLEIDGKYLPTREILEISNNRDILLFCTVSKIGYYEGHEGWRYILHLSK